MALRLLEVVQKDPTSIKCLFAKMFGASSKIAWKMRPKEMSCVYLRYLIAIWVRQADVVSCICSPRGGWGNQSGPGKDCRAPFKCRLLKDASSSRPPWVPHSWSEQRNSTRSGGWGTRHRDIDNHKMCGNGDSGVNNSALSPADIQKKDLAVLLFASLLSAETVCTLKPYWCQWRDSVSDGGATNRLLLVMAFQKFSKKLGRTLSNQKRYRIFQKKLYKLLLPAWTKLASCIVEWRIHLSMSLVGGALLSLRRINDHLDSLELAGLCSALRVLSEF